MKYKFLKYIPEDLDEGIIYISKEFKLAIHLCCCGCKSETVTPLGKGEWNYIKEEGKITLHPSIGNYSLPCKSHYSIIQGSVKWY